MDIENVIIIGSGPAAYSSVLYTKDKNPLMLRGSIGPGGQLTTTTHVDNYPGYPNGVLGPDLMDNMYDQVKDMGIRQKNETVINLSKEDNIFTVTTSENIYKSYSVIIGTGASARRLYVEGTHDNELWQKGISACAICDGYFFMDKICCVIGGGDSAMEEALFLSQICKKVYVIHRRSEFRCRADKLKEIQDTENIEILTPYNLKSAHGKENLEYIKLEGNGTLKDLKVDGLFFGIGHDPNTEFLVENFENILGEDKYIKADKYMKTEVEGLFTCGDVFDKHYRQAVTAASSGCIAGKSTMEYLKNKLI